MLVNLVLISVRSVVCVRDAVICRESQLSKPVSSGSLSEVQDSPTRHTWDMAESLAPQEAFGQPLFFTFRFSHLVFKSTVKNNCFRGLL